MGKKLIIANFKSNKDTSSITDWIKVADGHPTTTLVEVTVAPSHPYLHIGENLKTISLTAQDVSHFPQGSYTGAVNSDQLKDLGVKYTLVGHSERRKYFKESDQMVANKIDLLLENDIIPVVLLDSSYTHSQVNAIAPKLRAKCIYVYEPTADIGGTETADENEITSNINDIKEIVGSDIKVLYGGSVNENNISDVLKAGAEGCVVSSASLDPKQFIKVLEITTTHG